MLYALCFVNQFEYQESPMSVSSNHALISCSPSHRLNCFGLSDSDIGLDHYRKPICSLSEEHDDLLRGGSEALA